MSRRANYLTPPGRGQPLSRSTSVQRALGWPRLVPYLIFAFAALTLAGAQAPSTQAERSWELRVCAPPDELPFSSITGGGFENRIAELLADELGASLTYDWTAFTSDLIDRHFAEGTCDVIMGVADGFERGTNTLTYYQSPYVMVYRKDSGLSIDDMDDPDLADLRLGVQGLGTPPHEALRQRGLLKQVSRVYGGEEGEDRLAGLLNDVVGGAIDVGFSWGPVIGYYAARSDVDLVVKPVEPAFDFPSIFQNIPITMVVRRDDVAMRDRLNRAIIALWDDIQAVLAEYDIPVLDLGRPVLGEAAHDASSLRIGVVIPMPTGGHTQVARVNDLVGNAARMGALFAEGAANSTASEAGRDAQVLLASSPSEEAARRAAQALLARGEVDALVGGIGRGQAEVLADLAAEYGVPFVNIGSTSLLLRETCQPTTFHVQPSAGAYLDAMARLYRTGTASQDWFIVHLDSAEGDALSARAAAAFTAVGDRVVGSAAVEVERPQYFDVLADAKSSGAQVVAVLLGAADQVTLVGQAEDAGSGLRLAPFPDPLTQTREFLASINRYGSGTAIERLELWDPTISTGAAADLNSRFSSRWGQPFDSPAWAAYQGVSVLVAASRAGTTKSGAALHSALLEVDAGATGAKGRNVGFRASDHELRQPLYVVRVNQTATWGVQLSQRLAAGTLITALPSGATPTSAELDAIGLAGGGVDCGY